MRRRTGSTTCPRWCAFPVAHSGNHVRLLHAIALPSSSPAPTLAIMLEGEHEPLIGLSLASQDGTVHSRALLSWGHVVMLAMVLADAAERYAP